ncbi:MAG: ribosome small subunit-dependent GTPase A [Sphingobacteriia bacterium]
MPESHPDIETGIVMRSVGSSYDVRLPDGRALTCTLRGRLRLEENKATNPVAVGDHVRVDLQGESPVIADVLPRSNHLIRKAVKKSARYQVLAANIDQAICVACIDLPFTPLGYIDRFLVMAEAYHIPAVLVFNKVDLLAKDKHLQKLVAFAELYRQLGYRVEVLSALEADFRQHVVALLKDKVSFLVGLSGAGKSSLVNLADPGLNLRTGSISLHSGKGRHTTTFAEMHPLSFGGYVIDAPGFKEFDLVDIARAEVSHYFPEMRQLLPLCKYHNCTHTYEPGCAVKDALAMGEIAESRFNTYLNMLEAMEKP